MATYYIRSHRFEKTANGEVLVDRGTFDFEEALEIGGMLCSSNPIERINAQVAIWEKNGTLIKYVLVGVIFLLVIVVLIVSD